MYNVYRVANGVMAALFLLAVAVQYDDPDPVLWVAIYGAACVVTLVAALRRRIPRPVSGCIALVALIWGGALALNVAGLEAYAQMFDAWEMKSPPIEEAREASGLFIVAAWMSLLFFLHDASVRTRV
jgi:hypothetical protein